MYKTPVRLAKRHASFGDRREAHGTAVAQNEHAIACASFIDTRQTEVPDVVAAVVGHC